jgi:hypothetical protein
MPANSVTVSVSCWRRISIQHNSALLKEPLSPEKTFKYVALAGIKQQNMV